MERPVWYMQTNKKWSNISYSTKGENTTIGRSGCGPTCMAMVIATWKDKTVTPVTTCAWSLSHGYKAKGQGTFYTYFKPQGKAYGLNCYQLNSNNIYKTPNSKYHELAKKEVQKGNFVIACMGKGRWTSSGHFVLWYDVEGNNVLINDPASTKENRHKATFNDFKNEVKYYFVCENPRKNENKIEDNIQKEDDRMTTEERNEFLGYINKMGDRINKLENPMIYNYIDENMPSWARPTIQKLVDKNYISGTDEGLNLNDDLLRLLTILDRAGIFDK